MTSLKGNLSSVDLANIFQMLSMNQREGTLWIFDGQSRKAIYFGAEGVSMLTRGKHKPDALGRILLRSDKITPEQLQEALRVQADNDGRLLGQILVEQGAAARADIEEALRTQIEEEVYSLFIWKDAQFEFVEGPPDEEFRGGEGVTRLTFNVNSLIMEAAKRVDEWEWIQKVIPSTDEIFRYTGRNVALEDEIFGQTFSGKVLASVDGRRSVEEIIDVSCVNRFEVTKMLALLLEGGAIEALPVAELRREAQAALGAGDTDQAVKFLTRLVALKGDTPDMHRQLAEVFEGRRLLERAAFHYKVYAEILADSGERKQAFETYRRICEFLPTDVAAADRMIEIFAANPDGLEEHASEIIARGKLLAEVYGELGRQSRAIQVLHRVVAMGPDDQDLRQRLIQVYLQSGMPGEAIAEYEALAEAALAVRDFDAAERIYRKILQIDRNRDDAQTRLNQLVSKKRLRQRGIRLGIAAAVLLVVGSGLGFRGWQWYQEQKELSVANSSAFGSRLGDLRRQHQPLLEELDKSAKALSGAFREPAVMADELRKGAAARRDLVTRANAAVQTYHALAGEFPGVAEVEQARDAALALERKVQFVAAQEERLNEGLMRALDEQFDQLEPWPPAFPTHELDTRLRAITVLADAVPKWQGGEKGVRAQAYAKNVHDTLGAFEEMRGDVAAAMQRSDVETAQARIVAYLSSDLFPPRDLLEQIEFPRRIVSRPAGAQIHTNGADTGLVTPATVAVPILQKASLQLVKDGFERASVEIPALEQIDRHRLHADLHFTFEEVLHKELAFRTPPLAAKLQACPAVAGDKLIVPTKGNEAGVFDLTGVARDTLATKSVSGVQVRPVVAGGAVVLATYDGVLFHYGPAGEQLNRESLPGKVQADAAQWKDLAIFADLDGHVTAYDVRARKKAWTYPQSGPGHPQGFRVAPVVHDGELYLAGGDGAIVVLDPATGAERRLERVRDAGAVAQLATGLAAAGECLFVVARADKSQSRVICLDRRTLQVRSAFPLEGAVRQTPIAWQGFVYVVTDEGQVWAIQVVDDSLRSGQSLKLGTRVAAEPALDDGVLYVGDASGTLWALDVRGPQPERLYDFRIPGSERRAVRITTRPLVTATHVIFGADDNCVYGLKK